MDRLGQLLHLGDSALPAGGYAFSNGLEGAYQLGLLNSSTALEQYLRSAIEAAVFSEIPFVHSCYNASSADSPLAMLAFYDAMLTAPSVRRASLVLGKNWLRLLADLYPQAGLVELRRLFAAEQWPAHYTVVFGLTLCAAGFAEDEAQQLYLFQILRDQMSAAVRLGIVGPMEAARRQAALYPHAARMLAEVAGWSYLQAQRCAPQIEIAQGVHDYLYSRLFQS